MSVLDYVMIFAAPVLAFLWCMYIVVTTFLGYWY